MFDAQESIRAQENYCKENKLPHFAPHDGRCWSCNQQIYAEGKSRWNGGISRGVSVEKAGTELITGCPHCNRSYCD